MGLIVNQIKEMGLEQPIYASDRSVNPEFMEIAGRMLKGSLPPVNTTQKWISQSGNLFRRTTETLRNGTRCICCPCLRWYEPDHRVHSYGGLNKVLIRDELTSLKSYDGITGEIVFDASWNDIGRIWLAEIKDGEYLFSPADWKLE